MADAGASFSPSPLIPLPSRERGNAVVLDCFAPPCGYCLKASMTAAVRPALWIPAYAGMTVGFAKVSIKGEGDEVGRL